MEEAAPSLLLRAWLFFHNDVAYKWFMVYEMFYAVYVNHTKYGYCKIIQLPWMSIYWCGIVKLSMLHCFSKASVDMRVKRLNIWLKSCNSTLIFGSDFRLLNNISNASDIIVLWNSVSPRTTTLLVKLYSNVNFWMSICTFKTII